VAQTRVPRAYERATQAAPAGVSAGQHVAHIAEEDTVVFLIGMRINRWRKIRSWWPTLVAMPRMLRELASLDAGLLAARTFWSGRMFIVVQYWRSPEELGAYARDSQLRHAPAWGAFNKRAAGTGDIGMFHETYVVKPDAIESLYGNMPPFGLAAAYGWIPRADHARKTYANRRLQTTEPDYTAP